MRNRLVNAGVAAPVREAVGGDIQHADDDRARHGQEFLHPTKVPADPCGSFNWPPDQAWDKLGRASLTRP
ncbi:hypothetical protein Val02_87060 [Virgisporangium aliadipatigenens]|uniref:Uncharacterized protein n=1 Tax=Virgisporangium aliadipatigenens TaxID=741659 RepID=A0A8J4DUZ5_9ACTN|nr:hypothetical protein Val02_87060 [Virgisporangium aliadipatigenens]